MFAIEIEEHRSDERHVTWTARIDGVERCVASAFRTHHANREDEKWMALTFESFFANGESEFGPTPYRAILPLLVKVMRNLSAANAEKVCVAVGLFKMAHAEEFGEPEDVEAEVLAAI